MKIILTALSKAKAPIDRLGRRWQVRSGAAGLDRRRGHDDQRPLDRLTTLFLALTPLFVVRCGFFSTREVLPVFLGSSMAEHPAVNRRVAGSSPARGATCSQQLTVL